MTSSACPLITEFDLESAVEIDAQPCAQPDGPVRGFNLARVDAARRLASFR